MQAPFTELAKVYDAIFHDVEYEDWAEFVLLMLEDLGWQQKEKMLLLDLACGTAASAVPYVQRGFEVWAVDASVEMLAVAKTKLKPERVLCQNMLELELPVVFDVIACVFDSLNNLLLHKDVQQVFARVHGHLRAGAWFVFDMNTPLGVRELWDDDRMAGSVKLDGCELQFDWQHKYDAAKGLGLVTAHCWGSDLAGNVGDNSFDFTEQHWERGYEPAQVEVWLREVGFADVHFFEYPDGVVPGAESPRFWCFARKNGS